APGAHPTVSRPSSGLAPLPAGAEGDGERGDRGSGGGQADHVELLHVGTPCPFMGPKTGPPRPYVGSARILCIRQTDYWTIFLPVVRARTRGTGESRHPLIATASSSKTSTYRSTASSVCVTDRVHSSSRPGVMRIPRFVLNSQAS